MNKDPRSLFAARAAWQAKDPNLDGVDEIASVPPFEAVLARVRSESPTAPPTARGRVLSLLSRRRVSAVLAFAAAAAALVAITTAPDEAPVAIVAEPPASLACFDDPASLSIEASAYATDRAIASAEDHFAACLVASPCAAPRASHGCSEPAREPASDDVTCSAPRPLDDEIFASRIRGDSL